MMLSEMNVVVIIDGGRSVRDPLLPQLKRVDESERILSTGAQSSLIGWLDGISPLPRGNPT